MQTHSEPHSTSIFKKGLWWKVLLSSFVILLLGFLSGISTANSIPNWYATLEKPFFTPPNWLFGPAWTIIYILMGISFGRIWQVVAKSRYPIVRKFARQGLWVFVVQFALNLAWTPIFFGFKSPGWALFVIIPLAILVFLVIRHFFRLDRVAAFVLIPYLLWVTFASFLNLGIYFLN
jgi:tryptophan-rich sensory protein